MIRNLIGIFLIISTLISQDIHKIVSNADENTLKKLLMEKPELVNKRAANGRHSLFFTDKPAIIEILLQYKADPYITDKYGRTVLKYLMNYAVKFKQFRKTKLAALDCYLEQGIKFPVKGEEGAYFLHSGASIAYNKLTGHLISNAVDLKSKNENGGTLLHSIAAGGSLDYLQEIIKQGFELNAKNRYGMTALFQAAMEGHEKMVNALIKAGADKTLQADDGLYASDYAERFGHSAIADLLKNPPGKIHRKRISNKYLANEAGDKARIFARGTVSSVYFDHSSPVFTSDGKELYWGTAYTSRGDFILHMKHKNSKWSSPKVLDFCKKGGTYMYPTLSYDNNRLYFTGNVDINNPRKLSKTMNIFYVEKKGESWSEPEYIGIDGGEEYGLSIAENGNLYFMSFNEDDSFGSADLYISELTAEGYTKARNLGAKINSKYYDDEPYIAADESYLIFSSDRPKKKNERFFISRKQQDRTWGELKAIKLDFGNEKTKLRFPAISRDSEYFFFGSNLNGNWDIYRMKASSILNR